MLYDGLNSNTKYSHMHGNWLRSSNLNETQVEWHPQTDEVVMGELTHYNRTVVRVCALEPITGEYTKLTGCIQWEAMGPTGLFCRAMDAPAAAHVLRSVCRLCFGPGWAIKAPKGCRNIMSSQQGQILNRTSLPCPRARLPDLFPHTTWNTTLSANSLCILLLFCDRKRLLFSWLRPDQHAYTCSTF